MKRLLPRVILACLIAFAADADEFGNGIHNPGTVGSGGGGGSACAGVATGQMDYSNACSLIFYFTVFK